MAKIFKAAYFSAWLPTLENVTVTEIFESQLYACSFLVHVVQSLLQWGKDPIVIVLKKRREYQILSDAKDESVAPEEKEITPRYKR